MTLRCSRSIVLALALFVVACATNVPPSLSPAGTAAFHATRVVKALDVLQDFAIAAEAQTPKVLSTSNTRTVINYVAAAVKTIDAVPGGWKPTVLAGLVQLEHDLPAAEWQRIAPYVSLIKTLIESFQATLPDCRGWMDAAERYRNDGTGRSFQITRLCGVNSMNEVP